MNLAILMEPAPKAKSLRAMRRINFCSALLPVAGTLS